MTKIYLSSIIWAANQLIIKMEEGVDLEYYLGELREADCLLNDILDEVE